MDMRRCFICQRNRHAGGLERHHIFGGANRKLSEKYGLVVYLCHYCHNEPPYGVHHNKKTAEMLHRYGQKKAMKEQGWQLETFIEVFGKNYLDNGDKSNEND